MNRDTMERDTVMRDAVMRDTVERAWVSRAVLQIRLIASRTIASRPTASRCIVSRLWIFLAMALPLHAKEYPTKPIRLIVPFAPGGPTDIMSRAIGERITARLGQ